MLDSISHFSLNILSYNTIIPWVIIGSVVGMIIIIALFIAINGINKLDNGFSGKKIRRWSTKSIIVHWLGAIPCLGLIFSGLIIGGGKVVFDTQSTLWASVVHDAAFIHRIVPFVFIIAAIFMIAMWWKDQLFKKYDLDWFLKGGGYINFGKKVHPDAGFANAGEKAWFWTFVLTTITLSVTGIVMYFPEIAVNTVYAPIVILLHVISAITLGAFSVIHISMAMFISDGAKGGMLNGFVDKNWAKQHHNKWYETLSDKEKKGE